MHATQTLPESYQLRTSLDLSRRVGLAILLNLIGLGFLFVFFALFFLLAVRLRGGQELSLSVLFSFWGILALLGAIFLVLALHEGLHAIFFRIFTGKRPQVGFSSLYAYAGAPDWFLPRNRYLVVGIAPLIGITLLGFMLLPWISTNTASLVLFAMSVNAAGSIGDIAIVGYLLSQPADTLVQDYGDKFFIYRRSTLVP